MKRNKLILWLSVGIVLIFCILRITREEKISDFYLFVNESALSKREIADGEVGYNTFTDYQDEVDDEVDKIVFELREKNRNMRELYDEVIDVAKRNKNGLSSLKKYLSLIDSAKNITELTETAIEIETDLSVDIFTTMEIMSDYRNSETNIVYLMPISFDFGTSPHIFKNEDYTYYAALVKQYRIKFMTLYGYDIKEARNISSSINKWQSIVADNSKDLGTISDLSALYEIIDKSELQRIYSNIDIEKYVKAKGLDNQTRFSIVDRGNYEAFNAILTEENLQSLKEFIKFKIIEMYSEFLADDYAKLTAELNSKLLGIDKEYAVEDSAKSILESYFNDIVEKEYVERNFTSNEKNFIESMIEEIVSYYENDIESLDWLSEETKQKALSKLQNLKVRVGYPEEYDIISSKYVVDENLSLVDNIIAINRQNYRESLKKFEKSDEFKISLTTVNAYYSPQDNSINFPAAFAKFVDLDKNYYENLGTIGMIIAHEITHAFDNNGAKFDEKGNYENWWTDADYQKFEELQKKVISYYSQYRVDGVLVDGAKTVGENIADLGAVKAITQIAKTKGATEQEMRDMYISFAQMWAGKYTKEYQKLLMLSDTHAPMNIRVNATLSSCDEFYRIFDIDKHSQMYKRKTNRVAVW